MILSQNMAIIPEIKGITARDQKKYMKKCIKEWGASDQRLTPRVNKAGCTLLSQRSIPRVFLNLRPAQKTRSLLVYSYPDLTATTRHGDAVLVLRIHLCIMRVNLQVIENLQISPLDILPWNPLRSFSLRSHCSARVCWATSTRGESQQDEAEAHCLRKTQTTAESFEIWPVPLHCTYVDHSYKKRSRGRDVDVN